MKTNVDPELYMNYAFPRITVLVTTVRDGKPNAFTVAWRSPISLEPPLYGISVRPNRYSHDAILEKKEFVVNFPDFEIAQATHTCGRVSGKHKDKFELTGLTTIPASKVAPPLVKECYAHLECRLFDKVTLGDPTWITGEVVAVHADEERFENGLLKDASALLYLGKDTYTTSKDERRKFD